MSYPSRCRVLCAESTDDATLRISARLYQAFGTCAPRFGIGKGVARADAALAIELCRSRGRVVDAAFFVDLRNTNGSNGVIKASQAFFILACEPVMPLDTKLLYTDLRLQYGPLQSSCTPLSGHVPPWLDSVYTSPAHGR